MSPNITIIGSYAFQDCKSLRNIILPDALTSIQASAFKNCTNLSSVSFGKNLKSIGLSCFAGCSALTTISLPASVTSIEGYAFQDCSLTTVTVGVQEPLSIYSTVFSYYSNYTYYSYTGLATLYVPAGCKEAYEAADVWKDFKEINEMEPEPETDTDISQMDNAIYFEPTAGLVGTTIDLSVKLKNSLTPVGCSFMLTLPEGLRLLKDEDGDVIYTLGSRAKKMSLTMKDWDNGSYDFALTPSSGTATITGSDDVVVTFKVQIPDEMTAGDYKLRLTKCLIQSKDDGVTKDYPQSDVVTTLTVEDYVMGDVNGDRNVTPSDAIMTLYHYFNVEQSGFNVKAANVNGDGNVTPADAIEILYMYFGGGSQVGVKPIWQMREPQ